MQQSTPNAGQQALAKIEELGRGIIAPFTTFTRPDWNTVFDSIDATASQYVDALIAMSVRENDSQVSDGAPTVSDVLAVVKSRREKLPLSSGTTDQIVGICQTILAFGAAGLALSLGFSDKFHFFSVPVQKLIALTGIFYVELVLLSLFVLIWYLLQARFRYPFLYFKRIGNAWPFFYYGLISAGINRAPVQTARAKVKAGILYARDFVTFADRCLSETPHEQLRAELQQYYLLIAYQAYANQFSLRLANIFFYGVIGAILSTLLIGVWSVLWNVLR